MTLVRNETQRHSAALKIAGQNPVVLLPLDGVGSAVPSLQLHPVFGIDTERVPPNDAMSRFVGFGDKSWDNLKNFFQTQGGGADNSLDQPKRPIPCLTDTA